MRFPSALRKPLTSLGLLLAIPGLSSAGVLHPEQQHNAAVDGETLAARSSAAGGSTSTTLQFSLPDGDESYVFSIDGIPSPTEGPSCQPQDLDNVVVNGQPLKYSSTVPDVQGRNVYGSLYGTVTAVGSHDHEPHSITLSVDAICGDTPSDAVDLRPRVFEITIAEVDEARWAGPQFDQEFDARRDVSFAIRQPSSWRSEWDAAVEDNSAGPNTSVPGGADNVELAEDVIEQEISRLRQLQQELKAVQQSVDRQKTLVDNLHKDVLQGAREEITDCEGITCVLTTIYRKSKECIHLAYLRYKPSSIGPSATSDCYEMSPMSGSTRAKVLIGGDKARSNGNGCYRGRPRPHSDDVRPLLEGSDISDSASSSDVPDTFDSFGTSSSSTTNNIHTTLAMVVSLLCLTCLATWLRRRCCSPRARADRLARREERRTRRQFRCAARRHAWRDWWARKQWGLCRSGDCQRIQDYEEKRALILHQEAVLENAMQEEISRLQTRGSPGVMNEVLTMAEEGRMSHPRRSMGSRPAAGSGGSETLPAYRSRASSGRPPSYNEFDSSVSSFVADGFTNYTPSGSGNDETRSELSFSSDRTPASSIVNLSPRHSSETLRTERSAL